MDKIFYTLLGDKMKVKIFDMEDEKDLENEVNDFIDTMDGEIIDIKVSIDWAEKGKTIEIDGKKVTIWQSHQIYKTE